MDWAEENAQELHDEKRSAIRAIAAADALIDAGNPISHGECIYCNAGIRATALGATVPHVESCPWGALLRALFATSRSYRSKLW